MEAHKKTDDDDKERDNPFILGQNQIHFIDTHTHTHNKSQMIHHMGTIIMTAPNEIVLRSHGKLTDANEIILIRHKRQRPTLNHTRLSIAPYTIVKLICTHYVLFQTLRLHRD